MKPNWNPFAYLTMLSLLGLIGFATKNPGWFGFFGFLGWLRLAKTPYDERFRMNTARASQLGFTVAMVGVTVLVVMSALQFASSLISGALVVLFVAMILSFGVTVMILERRGD